MSIRSRWKGANLGIKLSSLYLVISVLSITLTPVCFSLLLFYGAICMAGPAWPWFLLTGGTHSSITEFFSLLFIAIIVNTLIIFAIGYFLEKIFKKYNLGRSSVLFLIILAVVSGYFINNEINNNEAKCARSSHPDACYYELATKKQDVDICNKSINSEWKADCERSVRDEYSLEKCTNDYRAPASFCHLRTIIAGILPSFLFDSLMTLGFLIIITMIIIYFVKEVTINISNNARRSIVALIVLLMFALWALIKITIFT